MLPPQRKQPPARSGYEVVYGDRAVWVNSASGCLGRFGARGMDVHRDLDQKALERPGCLYCTHERATLGDWRRFKAAMLEFHQIDLSDQPPPPWLASDGPIRFGTGPDWRG